MHFSFQRFELGKNVVPFDPKKLVHPAILSITPYVPGTTIEEATQEKGALDFIKIASNENPFGISPQASHAIRAAISSAYRYPEKTCKALREKIALKIGVSSDSIMVGNGADGIIYTLGMGLIDQNDEAIIPQITFSMYEPVVRGMRGKVIRSNMKDYAIDLDDIERRITDKTKVIFLCNPNNPTGLILERDDLLKFLASIPEDILIVLDEAYFDFSDPDKFVSGLNHLKQGQENIFIIRSFSKIFGLAGVRVGYGIGSNRLLDLLYRIRPPFDVSVLAAAAAQAAIEDMEFFNKTISLTNREKAFIYAHLDRLCIRYVESQTNFILLDSEIDSRTVYKKLLDRGVIVRASLHPMLPTHIRITVGKREHNERFLKAFEDILSDKQ